MSIDRYEDFIYLDQPTEFCSTLLFTDKYNFIQIHDNTPIGKDDVIGFVGVCKVENGEVISLDGDSYTKHMTVIGYEEFTTDNGELGLDLLVTNW